MIMDALNQFSSAQTLTTGSENGLLSTRSIDLGVARNIGAGENLFIVCQLSAAMTGSSGNALTVELVTDDNEGLNSPTAVQTLGVFPTNSAVGTRKIARINPGTFERFIGLKFTSATALTGCGMTAFIAKDVDVNDYYANGFTIANT